MRNLQRLLRANLTVTVTQNPNYFYANGYPAVTLHYYSSTNGLATSVPIPFNQNNVEIIDNPLPNNPVAVVVSEAISNTYQSPRSIKQLQFTYLPNKPSLVINLRFFPNPDPTQAVVLMTQTTG